MSRFVITGSSGRVGRAIHFKLAMSHDVVGVDLNPGPATSVIADILDFDALCKVFENKDAVVHVAALHAPHVGQRSDDDFQKINVQGTANVVRAACQCGVGRIVLTSTTALYGLASQLEDRAAWIDEETVPEPRSIYHRTKLEAEQIIRECASEDMRVRVVRMSRCFPEPAPLMAMYRLHRGIDVRDVADAHVAAAFDSNEEQFMTLVVSGKTPFTREDCFALKSDAEDVLRQRCPILVKQFEQRGWRLPATIDRVYDPGLAKQKLGWESRYGADEVFAQLDRESCEVLPPDA